MQSDGLLSGRSEHTYRDNRRWPTIKAYITSDVTHTLVGGRYMRIYELRSSVSDEYAKMA